MESCLGRSLRHQRAGRRDGWNDLRRFGRRKGLCPQSGGTSALDLPHSRRRCDLLIARPGIRRHDLCPRRGREPLRSQSQRNPQVDGSGPGSLLCGADDRPRRHPLHRHGRRGLPRIHAGRDAEMVLSDARRGRRHLHCGGDRRGWEPLLRDPGRIFLLARSDGEDALELSGGRRRDLRSGARERFRLFRRL